MKKEFSERAYWVQDDLKNLEPIAKLLHVTKLSELDPELLKMPIILGEDTFIKIIKSFAGKTIKIPSIQDLKEIAKQVRRLHKILEKDTLSDRDKSEISDLIRIGKPFESKSMRKASEENLTDNLIIAYYTSVFNRSSKYDTLIANSSKNNSVAELYEFKIKEIKAATQFMTVVGEVNKILENKKDF